MMDVKPGAKTTEFWLAALSSLTLALLALFVGYGLINQEQSDLWYTLGFRSHMASKIKGPNP